MRKIVCPALLLLAFAITALGQNYTIQTFAGGGVPQNIQAASASLGPVTGIATDSSGNVYIALQAYSVVVRMDVTGALTLVAGTGKPGFSGDGGPATSAQLNSPWGLAIDTAGNLYIADSGNNRIRKVSNGVITTIPVNLTGASLSNPTGVAVDSSGNLYVAAAGNNLILKVSGGVTVPIAGTGTAGFNATSGPATSVQLNSPWGVAVDAAGNFYIADYGNNAVWQLTNGILTALFQFPGPIGITSNAGGDLYITSFSGQFVALSPTNGNGRDYCGKSGSGLYRRWQLGDQCRIGRPRSGCARPLREHLCHGLLQQRRPQNRGRHYHHCGGWPARIHRQQWARFQRSFAGSHLHRDRAFR